MGPMQNKLACVLNVANWAYVRAMTVGADVRALLIRSNQLAGAGVGAN